MPPKIASVKRIARCCAFPSCAIGAMYAGADYRRGPNRSRAISIAFASSAAANAAWQRSRCTQACPPRAKIGDPPSIDTPAPHHTQPADRGAASIASRPRMCAASSARRAELGALSGGGVGLNTARSFAPRSMRPSRVFVSDGSDMSDGRGAPTVCACPTEKTIVGRVGRPAVSLIARAQD